MIIHMEATVRDVRVIAEDQLAPLLSVLTHSEGGTELRHRRANVIDVVHDVATIVRLRVLRLVDTPHHSPTLS